MIMAESMTYSSLKTDISAYADRDDVKFLAQVPRLIMLAESRLCTEVRGLGLQRYAAGSASSGIIAKPSRWRETISFDVIAGATRTFLKPRSYDYCRFYAAENTGGVPRYYADYGFEHFLVVPNLGVPFNFELAYYERPEPLSMENETNWLTQYAPQLLLYATLLEAQPWLKRQERIAEFQSLYDRALQGIAQETTRRISGDRTSTSRNGE